MTWKIFQLFLIVGLINYFTWNYIISYAPNPGLCLLNDNSDLNIKQILNKIMFAGFTAKKLL